MLGAVHCTGLFCYVQGLYRNLACVVMAVRRAGLYAWRDKLARAEDESPGYVLSRSLLQQLAMQLPTAAHKVKSLCKSR